MNRMSWSPDGAKFYFARTSSDFLEEYPFVICIFCKRYDRIGSLAKK